ncbi:hypothetical protein CPC08DRAFT_47354 [Agrocybe pediades]|nr:hypothetical protein CPC08DRAFT_47354 [Agrocybe pediades]
MTGSLFDQALDLVKKSEDTLKDLKARKIVEPEYKIDVLLIDMVTEAPHEAGQRFVSIAIILAHEHDRVVGLALAWMKRFALRLLALAFTVEAEEGHFSHILTGVFISSKRLLTDMATTAS